MPRGTASLRWYGSASMQETDAGSPQGGAILLSRKVGFADLVASGRVRLVSESAADTTQTVTVTYRGQAGEITSVVGTLQGQATVLLAPQMARLLKAVKSATTAGRVAVEAAAATLSGALTGTMEFDVAVLPVGASSVDGAYVGQVLRLTGGTGVGQIRMIVAYEGSTRLAYLGERWTTRPATGTTFRLAPGIVFDLLPSEITEVRQPFYNVQADVSPKTAYEKVFVKNVSVTYPVTDAQVVRVADPLGRLTFAVVAAAGDTGTVADRLTAPGGLTFDDQPKVIGEHDLDDAWGVWLRLDVPAGDVSRGIPVVMREEGTERIS